MSYVTLRTWTTLSAFLVAILPSGMAAAGQAMSPEFQGSDTHARMVASASDIPVYQPPKRGAPGGRVGGGTRGPGDDMPVLSVLAPNHIGLTTQEQPTLYWYLSKPTTYPVELAIIQSQGIQPGKTLVETHLPVPARAGVQAIRLTDHGVRLVPGEQYQWFVALIRKPSRRSNDIIAGGFIERVAPPAATTVSLAQAGKTMAPHIYADSGFWYDAVMALSDMIDAAPTNSRLRKQRAALMQQVGLPEVAEYDLKRPTAE